MVLCGRFLVVYAVPHLQHPRSGDIQRPAIRAIPAMINIQQCGAIAAVCLSLPATQPPELDVRCTKDMRHEFKCVFVCAPLLAASPLFGCLTLRPRRLLKPWQNDEHNADLMAARVIVAGCGCGAGAMMHNQASISSELEIVMCLTFGSPRRVSSLCCLEHRLQFWIWLQGGDNAQSIITDKMRMW